MPGDGKEYSVIHPESLGLLISDEIHIDDAAAEDAQETGGVKLLLDTFECAAKRDGLLVIVKKELCVFICYTKVHELFKGQPVAGAVECDRKLIFLPHAQCVAVAEAAFKLYLGEWRHQVIAGTCLIGEHGVFDMCPDKDQVQSRILLQELLCDRQCACRLYISIKKLKIHCPK